MPGEVPWTRDLLADVELFGRMGATGFETGHLDDTPLAVDARWWAKVTWRGVVMTEDEHTGPAEATRALALRLLEGGQCVHCGRHITVPGMDLASGADSCRWYVDDEHWLRGCAHAHGPPAGGLNRAQRRRQEKIERLRR